MATPSKVEARPAVDEAKVAASIPQETGIVWVTPDLAKLWLTRNQGNRKLRDDRIQAHARDMKAGKWAFTGEAVKFSSTGRLIDGQHRLLAIVRSNATVKMLVVAGVADEAQMLMDTGARRTASDALKLRGEANAFVLAAAVRFAIVFETRRDPKQAITHAEVLDWLAHHPDIRRQATIVQKHTSKLDFKPSVFCYALWKFNKLDPSDAEIFTIDLVQMRSGGIGDPIYTLLNRMRTARRNREYVLPIVEYSFIVRTWNAFRAGTELKILKTLSSDWDIPQPK